MGNFKAMIPREIYNGKADLGEDSEQGRFVTSIGNVYRQTRELGKFG